MSVIKLKQGDIENIVKNIVSEQVEVSEELPTDTTENQSVKELTLFQDSEGNLYALDDSDPTSPKVVATTKK